MNLVVLIGRIGADPELRETASGSTVGTFSVATSRRTKNKDDEWVEETTWHKVVCFGKNAEFAAKYLLKGREVSIQGRISNRSWEDDEGNKKYISEVVADTVTGHGARTVGDEGEPEAKPRSKGGDKGGGGKGGRSRNGPDPDLPFIAEAHPDDLFALPGWERMSHIDVAGAAPLD